MIDWEEILEIRTDLSLLNKAECKALYTRISAKAQRAKLPLLKVNLQWPRQEILNEIKSLDDKYWHYIKKGKKYYLPIHVDMTNPLTSKAGTGEYSFIDGILDKLPILTNWILSNNMHYKLGRIGVVRLPPGGFIRPHTDGTIPYQNWIHMLQSTKVKFFFRATEISHIPTGCTYALDHTIMHSVINVDKIDRYNILYGGRIKHIEFIKLLRAEYL